MLVAFVLDLQAEELPMYEQIVRALAAAKITTERELQRVINEHRRELHVSAEHRLCLLCTYFA